MNLPPLTVVVLDRSGNLVAMEREGLYISISLYISLMCCGCCGDVVVVVVVVIVVVVVLL